MNISSQSNPYLKQINDELWLVEEDRENLKISYRVKEILAEKQSPFQHVMIVDLYDFGPALVLDGVVQTTSKDGFIYNEMITHIALASHPNPKQVLIIGGGDCGAAREAVKYSKVEKVDVVEIDEVVVQLSRSHLKEVSGNLDDPKVHFMFTDGIEYIQSLKDHYDIVIVDSSDPVGPAEQLFTYSFYSQVQQSLKKDGIFVCQSESPILYSDVLRSTFQHIDSLYPIAELYTAVVPTYPGGLWSFTYASKEYPPLHAWKQYQKLDLPSTSFEAWAGTKYITDSILENCFQLPQFLKEIIQQIKNVNQETARNKR